MIVDCIFYHVLLRQITSMNKVVVIEVCMIVDCIFYHVLLRDK